MSRSHTSTLLGGAGIIIILAALYLLIQSGALANLFRMFSNGTSIECNARVDAELFGDELRFIGNPVCTKTGACTVNGLNEFSIFGIGDETGVLKVKYGQYTYASKDVVANVLAPSSTSYSFSACVPENAEYVNMTLYGPTGGVLSAKPTAIN